MRSHLGLIEAASDVDDFSRAMLVANKIRAGLANAKNQEILNQYLPSHLEVQNQLMKQKIPLMESQNQFMKQKIPLMDIQRQISEAQLPAIQAKSKYAPQEILNHLKESESLRNYRDALLQKMMKKTTRPNYQILKSPTGYVRYNVDSGEAIPIKTQSGKPVLSGGGGRGIQLAIDPLTGKAVPRLTRARVTALQKKLNADQSIIPQLKSLGNKIRRGRSSRIFGPLQRITGSVDPKFMEYQSALHAAIPSLSDQFITASNLPKTKESLNLVKNMLTPRTYETTPTYLNRLANIIASVELGGSLANQSLASGIPAAPKNISQKNFDKKVNEIYQELLGNDISKDNSPSFDDKKEAQKWISSLGAKALHSFVKKK